jgi:hypothetical protein
MRETSPPHNKPMLEIHKRDILDEFGTPIAVQIPIAQFETLLNLLRDPAEITVVTEETDFSVEELQGAVAIGLQALDSGQYGEMSPQ